MALYKFFGRGPNAALTKDKSGSNLPTDKGPWRAAGIVPVNASDGPRIGASSDEIIAAVEATGYFILPST